MGLGGMVAIAGGLLFVVIMLRAMRGGHSRSSFVGGGEALA